MNFSKLTGTKPPVPASDLKADRPYRIALVVKNRVNPAYLSAMKAGDDAAARYGVEVEHFVPATPDDLHQQNALLDAVLEGGFDAVLVTPVDADAQTEVFRRFNADGVPIHNFSNAVAGAEVATFVASDDGAIGESVIDWLAGATTSGEARLCVVAGSPTTPTARDRLGGVHRGLARHLGLVVLEEAPAYYDRMRAHDLVLRWLTTHSGIDAIVALNDEMAIGAMEALQSVEREGVIVTGVNGTPEGLLAVQDGRLAITVDYALYSMTELSIELAVRNLNGERLAKQESYLDAEVIDAVNVATFIEQRRAWGIM